RDRVLRGAAEGRCAGRDSRVQERPARHRVGAAGSRARRVAAAARELAARQRVHQVITTEAQRQRNRGARGFSRADARGFLGRRADTENTDMKHALAGITVLAAGVCLIALSAAGDQSAFSDFRSEKPGVIHKITVGDLPAPFATASARNNSTVVPRPEGVKPQALPGYSVALYADGLENPRLMRTAPNGDVFVAESRPGRITVIRGRDASGRAQTVDVFADGLTRPFGIAFYPPGPNPTHLYVGNTDAVVRFPYQVGDLKARGPKEAIAGVPTSTPPGRGHCSRAVAFSRAARTMSLSLASPPTLS